MLPTYYTINMINQRLILMNQIRLLILKEKEIMNAKSYLSWFVNDFYLLIKHNSFSRCFLSAAYDTYIHLQSQYIYLVTSTMPLFGTYSMWLLIQTRMLIICLNGIMIVSCFDILFFDWIPSNLRNNVI